MRRKIGVSVISVLPWSLGQNELRRTITIAIDKTSDIYYRSFASTWVEAQDDSLYFSYFLPHFPIIRNCFFHQIPKFSGMIHFAKMAKFVDDYII
jgi:hypothetical protein